MTALQDNALSQAQRNAEEYIINNGVSEVAAGADGWDLIRRNYTPEQIEKIMARFVQNAPEALSTLAASIPATPNSRTQTKTTD